MQLNALCSFRRVQSLSLGHTDPDHAVIQGDNLQVLKNLKDEYSSKVRCVYIDPPYNNQETYRHYKDRGGHEEWIESLLLRIKAIHPLLSDDGSLWISIDDREVHYLKVAADAVFGRENFVSTIVWQHRTTRENRKTFSNNHEYILVYAKDKLKFKRFRNLLPPSADLIARYKNPDHDSRGPWQSVSLTVQDGHATKTQYYYIKSPSGIPHYPPKGRCWIYTKEKMEAQIAAGNVWWGKSGDATPRQKKFLLKGSVGLTPETLWTADIVGTTDDAKKHILDLFPNEPVFDTPKPEKLIGRIVELATNPGDLVLDAYLGSGTTAAVCQKLKRKCIGIEVGDHAATLCAERLKRVAAGEGGGISADVKWRGGGGFSFYKSLQKEEFSANG